MTTRKKMFHKNVRRICLISFTANAANSIWSDTALAAFLLIKTGSNSKLGLVEAVQGIAQLLMALPTGYVADKIGKAKVIRLSTILSVSFPFFLAYVVFTTTIGGGDWNSHSYLLFMVGMILSGFQTGIVLGPMQALFADSSRHGERSVAYNYLFASWLLGSVCGPLVTIFIFQSQRNTWTVQSLAIVILSGLALSLVASIGQLFVVEADVDVDDEKRKEKEEDNEALEPLLSSSDDSVAESSSAVAETTSKEEEHSKNSSRQWLIPYIVFFSDVIMGFGSGMTIKFFPLFWKEDNNMTPTQVQAIYVLMPLCTIVAATMMTQLSKYIRRVETGIVCIIISTCSMFLLIFLYNQHASKYLLVPVYLLRSAFANAKYPIQESILMDYVSSETRARWKSLDSIAMLGWSGSAFIGGIIADKDTYLMTFKYTALIQFIGGVVVWLPLLPLVETESSSK